MHKMYILHYKVQCKIHNVWYPVKNMYMTHKGEKIPSIGTDPKIMEAIELVDGNV